MPSVPIEMPSLHADGVEAHADQAGGLHALLHLVGEVDAGACCRCCLRTRRWRCRPAAVHVVVGHAGREEHRLRGALRFRLGDARAVLVQHRHGIRLREWRAWVLAASDRTWRLAVPSMRHGCLRRRDGLTVRVGCGWRATKETPGEATVGRSRAFHGVFVTRVLLERRIKSTDRRDVFGRASVTVVLSAMRGAGPADRLPLAPPSGVDVMDTF